MLVEGRSLGTISILLPQRNALTEEYCDLLKTVANQAGVAIQRARLFGHTQRMANEMRALYDVGLHTGSTLSISEVIKRTANNIEMLMHPDMFYIALYDAETDSASFEHVKDHGEIMPRMKVPLGPEGYGLTGRIIRTKEPVLVRDWTTSGYLYAAIAQKSGTDMLSYLGVPMIFDDRVMGVLSVQAVDGDVFDEESQRLLEAMAAQTAMALENARLHALAQEAAQIDSLTQVYNHGRFIKLVHEAINESNKNDSQVSLIMLDIDFFKQYNDTFGHVAGDHVLALTAQALKSCVRVEDSVGRWGGEEFGVLLPGLSIDSAKTVARRIRHAIAELVPLDANGMPLVSPTISQGISTYPYPSREATGLIEDADAALYYAKEHGRNQLVMFDTRGSHELIFRTGTLTPESLMQPRKAVRSSNTGYTTSDLDGIKAGMHDATTTTDDLYDPATAELERDAG
jgi:diguanylate cyclase (GGDEF)-like protein